MIRSIFVYMLSVLLLLAQTYSNITETTTTPIDVSGVSTLITTLITTLLPVILLIAVLGWVFKILNKIPSMLSILIPLFLIVLSIGQTESSTNISSITSLLLSLMTAILPLIVIVMVLQMVFKLFDSFGRLFISKIWKVNFCLRLLPLASLVAQTSTDQAQQIASLLSQLMMPLITVLFLIAIPILVFKALAEGLLGKI